MPTLSLVDTKTKIPATFSSPTDLANSLVDYFAQPEVMEEEVVTYNRDGEAEIKKVPRYRPMPIVEEWCAANRMTRRQLNAAAEKYEEIGEAMEFAKDVMKVYLIRKGLTEQYNAQFSKFVATNEVGMVERSETINKNLNVKGSDLLDEIEKASKPLRRN